MGLVFLTIGSLLISCALGGGGSLDERHEHLEGDSLVLDSKSPLGRSPLWSPLQRQITSGYYFLAGEYLRLHGDFSHARMLFNLAYDLDPKAVFGLKALELGPAGSHLDEAFFLKTQRLALLYPTDPRLRVVLAKVLIQRKQYNKAKKELEHSLLLDPTLEPAALQLVWLHKKLEKPKLARDVAHNLVKANPHSQLAITLLRDLYLGKQDYSSALEWSQKLVSHKVTNQNMLIHYFLLSKAGKKEKAKSVFLDLYRKSYFLSQDFLERSQILVSLFGDPKLARLEVQNYLSTEGYHYNLELQLAFLYWYEKDFEAVIEILDRLRDSEPGFGQILVLTGMVYQELGRIDEAIRSYERVAKETSSYLTARHRLAALFQGQGQLDRALEVVLTLVRYKYVTWDTYALGASIYAKLEKFSNAVSLLDQGCERYPKKVELIFLRGVYEERGGQEEKSIKTMLGVLHKDPWNNGAYNHLAYLYAEKSIKLDEAEELALIALSLKPEDGYYLDTLGWVYYKMGRFKKALKYLLDAVRKFPKEGVILEHVGDVYLALEDSVNALLYYKKSLQYLDGKEKPRVKEKIQELSEA